MYLILNDFLSFFSPLEQFEINSFNTALSFKIDMAFEYDYNLIEHRYFHYFLTSNIFTWINCFYILSLTFIFQTFFKKKGFLFLFILIQIILVGINGMSFTEFLLETSGIENPQEFINSAISYDCIDLLIKNSVDAKLLEMQKDLAGSLEQFVRNYEYNQKLNGNIPSNEKSLITSWKRVTDLACALHIENYVRTGSNLDRICDPYIGNLHRNNPEKFFDDMNSGKFLKSLEEQAARDQIRFMEVDPTNLKPLLFKFYDSLWALHYQYISYSEYCLKQNLSISLEAKEINSRVEKFFVLWNDVEFIDMVSRHAFWSTACEFAVKEVIDVAVAALWDFDSYGDPIIIETALSYVTLITSFANMYSVSFCFIFIYFVIYLIYNKMLSNNTNTLIPTLYQILAENLYKLSLNLFYSILGKHISIPEFFIKINTIFIFLIISNVQGMIPYMSTLTSALTNTFFIALALFLSILTTLLDKKGINYFLNLFMPSGCPILLSLLIIPIEVISYSFRLVSLSVRLFANMMAGHTLLKVIVGFSWIIIFLGNTWLINLFPILILFILTLLEFGVAIIQAYIFTVLSCIYLRDIFEGH